MSAHKTLKDSPLPTVTQERVALHASQINGCSAYIDIPLHPRVGLRRQARPMTCMRGALTAADLAAVWVSSPTS